jgi:transcriptional regulator of heat shock response
MERYLALKQKSRATKRKLANAKKQLRSHFDQITLDEVDQNMKDILRSAVKYVTDTETSCQKAILHALLDLEQKQAVSSKGQSRDEDDLESSTNEELADLIVNEIKNNAKIIAGQGCTIRYSARTVRIAMSLWLRSPAAYQEFKGASLSILPLEQ